MTAKQRRAASDAHLHAIDLAWGQKNFARILLWRTLRALLADITNARQILANFKRHMDRGTQYDMRLRWLQVVLVIINTPFRTWRKIRFIQRSRTIANQNLLGDRDVEWSWIAAQMPPASGEALDFGGSGGYMGLLAAQRGFHVTTVDLGMAHWPYIHPQLSFIQGDILTLPLPQAHFNLVINCSTIEHVGLAGSYGATDDQPDGDLQAMGRLRDCMKPDGVMLLTTPVGRDAVFSPFTRIYGVQRLPQLLAGFEVEKEVFWVKSERNQWILCDRATALDFEATAVSSSPLENVYALGCFVLRRPLGEQ